MAPTSMVLQLADAIVAVDKTDDKTGSTRLRALVLLAGFVGLRPGELVALRREDMDPLHRLVTVDENAPRSGCGCWAHPSQRLADAPWLIPRRSCRVEAHLERFVEPEPDA